MDQMTSQGGSGMQPRPNQMPGSLHPSDPRVMQGMQGGMQGLRPNQFVNQFIGGGFTEQV